LKKKTARGTLSPGHAKVGGVEFDPDERLGTGLALGLRHRLSEGSADLLE